MRQWAKRRKKEYLEGTQDGVVIERAMDWSRKAATNYCRLWGGKGLGNWWENKVGRGVDATCPRCGLEEDTPDHIVFRCRKVERVKDKEGRKELVREVGVRWDSWEALALKRWLRMACSGQVDDEGRPILKKVDLVEEFFANIHHQIKSCN